MTAARVIECANPKAQYDADKTAIAAAIAGVLVLWRPRRED